MHGEQCFYVRNISAFCIFLSLGVWTTCQLRFSDTGLWIFSATDLPFNNMCIYTVLHLYEAVCGWRDAGLWLNWYIMLFRTNWTGNTQHCRIIYGSNVKCVGVWFKWSWSWIFLPFNSVIILLIRKWAWGTLHNDQAAVQSLLILHHK